MRRLLRLAWVAAACLWASASLGGQIVLEPGSEPGWAPPEGAEEDVLDKVRSVLTELDEERYDQIYWGLDPDLKQDMSEDLFAAFNHAIHEKHGRMTSSHVLRVSWNKARAGGALTGVYAAVDVMRTFAFARRDCGYIILHQAEGDPNWRVLRIDDHSMSDADYDDMVRKGHRRQAEALWAQLKRGCPNAP